VGRAREQKNLDGSSKAEAFGRPGFSFLKNLVLPKALFLTVGLPKNSFGSVDLTNRCNLRCKHCYFFEQENPEELSDEKWLKRLEALSKGPFRTYAMTWVGGEPLLRKDLLEKAVKFFNHNLIVTNGLIPLPNWPDVYFHVSLDGDREAHEKQRDQEGIYDRIKENANRPDLDVSMVYCISSLNAHCVEKVLEEWRPVGVRGFLFSFYTPMGTGPDPLFPGWDVRDRLVDRLIELKKTTYGSFIENEPGILRLMKSENSKKVTDRCQFFSKGFALDPMGERKPKCMMGEQADCDRCGCIVPFYLHWRTEKKKVARDLMADLSAYISFRARGLFKGSPSDRAPR
jgi:MoaA/NifB/PqqE/SkfB family radical SAM enzyme